MTIRSPRATLCALAILFAPTAWAAEPLQHLPSFAAVVQKVLPAVVDVAVVRIAPLDQDEDEDGPDDAPPPNVGSAAPSGELVRAPFAPDPKGEAFDAQGSGFLIDPAGYVVTSAHVIEAARIVTVSLRNGSRYPARIVGTDAASDLALLKINAGRALPAVSWGDSDAVAVGEWVLAAGNPFGLVGSMSAGILSARGRDIDSDGPGDLLQIDAPLNRGNSGGPTFNDEGEVIGVNTAIFTPSGGSVGIGFAVPSATARPVIEQLRAHGRVVRGWLGVMPQDMTPVLARSLGLEVATGALITDVTPGGPAARAGLRRGDVVLAFDGISIVNRHVLARAAAAVQPGRRVALTLWRDGRHVALSAVITERPIRIPATALPAQPESMTVLGITLAALDDEFRHQLGLPQSEGGILVLNVAASSPFAGSGLERGDVIQEIDRQSASSLRLAAARLKEVARTPQAPPILVLVDRGGEKRYVALALSPAGASE